MLIDIAPKEVIIHKITAKIQKKSQMKCLDLTFFERNSKLTKIGKILLIMTGKHPQRNIRQRLNDALKNISEVYCATTIQEGLHKLSMSSFQLVIIIDLGNTEMTYNLINHVRKLDKVPILVITQLGIREKAAYIMAGADVTALDDFTKKEIELQAFALLRRYSEWEKNTQKPVMEIKSGSLSMSRAYRRTYWKEIELELTNREFEFLYFLASTPERVYTYDQIYQHIWKDYPEGDFINMVWCMVKRIKKKIKKVIPEAPEIIYSVRNVGYYFKMNNNRVVSESK